MDGGAWCRLLSMGSQRVGHDWAILIHNRLYIFSFSSNHYTVTSCYLMCGMVRFFNRKRRHIEKFMLIQYGISITKLKVLLWINNNWLLWINGVITYLEPGILECEVKWALGSITMNKTTRGDGIPADLFQILKDEDVRCCTQYASKFGKLSSGYRVGKGQFLLQFPKKGDSKECSNSCTNALISHTSKEMLKILQARLQQYMNQELPDGQVGFRKGRGTRDQIGNICWIIEKTIPEKHLLLLHWLL